MELSNAIAAYLDYIKYQRGLSPRTVVSYKSWLHHFQNWVEVNGYPNPSLDAFATPILTRFLHALVDRQLRPRTIRGVFYPLRGLGDYLTEQGQIPENFAKKITLPKKDAAIRLLVTDEEISALLDACERQSSEKKVALSRALLSVLIYGGLRRQELLDLHPTDINLEDGSILVRSGKGSKSRKVFVCRACVDALREWITFRSRQHEQNEWLWAFGNTRRVSADGLKGILETVKAIAGIRDSRICPHGIRHNAASRLMKNGANLGAISNFLGHSNISTTQIYLHVSEEELKGIADLGALTSSRRPSPSSPTDDKNRSPSPVSREIPRRNRTASFLRQRRTS